CIHPGKLFMEGNFVCSSTTLASLADACVVDKRAPHQLSRESIEVLPVRQAGLSLCHQFEEQLVDQRRCLQRVTLTLPTQIRGGQIAELRIDQRSQAVK